MREITQQIYPKRDPDAHKGVYGKLYVYAGSEGMMGACHLTTMAALRSGVGRAYIATTQALANFYNISVPEAIVISYQTMESKKMLEDIEKMDVVIIGPGLGTSDIIKANIKAIINTVDIPVVLDADGINNLTMEEIQAAKAPLILTPHYGEISRLTRVPIPEIKEDPEAFAQKIAKALGVLLVLKGHQTIITDGDNMVRNSTGNPGMATAGSGDVLCGIIGANLARGNTPWASAFGGVYLHGHTGDLAVKKYGEYSLLASDIIEFIPAAIMDIS